ncbi:MAG: carbohydrate ABC transporter permease [Xylanivirga thermophila]|uniref:carbohydrate ABC transporter permease n=1 Tax=Xylanivirga thermophila TaxID=2496273 RepID=UPI0013EB2593
MKRSLGDNIFNIVNYIIMLIIAVCTLYPFLHVLAVSFNDSIDTVRGGITIVPRVFTLENYKKILDDPSIGWATFISALRTLIGTALGIFSTSMLAYVLSRQDFFARKFVSALFVTTMYISGGMIPGYMLMRNLNLINSFLVYIIPGLISAFNVIILRSYIEGLPIALQESAKLDGANDFIIFAKIIMPLCVPAIATLSLFIAVGHWNSWFDTYLYCGHNKRLTTLQFELQKILVNAQVQLTSSQDIHSYGLNKAQAKTVSPESIRMAMTVVATVPILLVYPFVQKYFVQGLVLGAVKN